MSFTTSQLATLKAVAQADPTAAGYIASLDDVALASWFNGVTSFVVWRSVLPARDARAAIITGGGAAQLDALTAGKRDSLFWLLEGDLDTSNTSVRAAIDDLCGSQNTLKSSLLAAMKRYATRAEKALATGTGTDAAPANLTWYGTVTQAEASWIRG